MRRRVAAALLASLTTATLAACSPTTYNASDDTKPPTAATTTTLPVGTAAELLPVMLVEVQGLATRVANSDGAGQSATRIEQLWAAIKPEIEAKDPDLVPDFEFVVRRCRSAADRKRPADADRAYKNLTSLTAAILG